MNKLYCYVDESGQDTFGDLFVVCVVLLGEERHQVAQRCESIELETGRGNLKWSKTRYDKRLAYIRRILQEPMLEGKLNCFTFRNSIDYLSLTVQAVVASVLSTAQQPYRVTILIDGLARSQYGDVGSRLRQSGVLVRKVRGVKQDENDALIRLADSLCGFVRAATEGQEEMMVLYARAKRERYLRET